jgi:hypothetical protein
MTGARCAIKASVLSPQPSPAAGATTVRRVLPTHPEIQSRLGKSSPVSRKLIVVADAELAIRAGSLRVTALIAAVS